MVKTTLVEQDLAEGRRFLDALKKPTEVGVRRLSFGGASHFRIKAAFWWYLSESDEWRLFIATPLVDEEGPLATYKDIQRILAFHPDLNLSLQNISVLSPKDERVKAFNKELKIAPDPVGVRFTRSALNGTYIEDAYVYRLH
ncbi:MAG TPA: hypothetical protein VI837_09520 [Blastocatellia bacterium]|nr:hypothetical protein [Blastocatellia bacterium]